VSRIVGALSLSGDTERLTRVAANNEIHDATPRSAVKGSEICPYRRIIQGFFFDARSQARDCICFVFHETD
jgi:hypothetical protein